VKQSTLPQPLYNHTQQRTMLIEDFTVSSPIVEYTEEHITSTYSYDSTKLTRTDKGSWVVTPTTTQYQFRVDRRVPKLG
jgi:myo-inositol-1-phosphate synthase